MPSRAHEEITLSAFLPNGSVVSLASGYGVSKTMSALTNANPAVATLEASHGVIVTDILEVTSGWERLNNRILRASVVATNDVTLEGLNALSTSIYPAGTGIGSVREVTGWAQVPQIVSSSKSGGEQQFTTFQFLSAKTQQQLPTVKSAQGLKFELADDPSLAIYATLRAADEDGLNRAVKIQLPSGAVIYYNAIVSFNDNPSLDTNEIMKVEVTLSFQAAITRYTS